MREHIEEFLLHLDTERGLSANYQLSTRRSLEAFAEWLERSRVDLSAVTPETLTEFLAHRKRLDLAPASIKLEAVALRIFFRFLRGRGVLREDPAIFLTTPRIDRLLPETLHLEEVERLLAAIPRKSPVDLRDLAIFELLYACGLRASELCNFRLEELYPEERFVRVTGKGNKTRMVPVGGRAIQALTDYLEKARPELLNRKSGSHVFLSVRGRALTPQRIWQLARQYADTAGLSQKVYPHLFRHSFATHLLANGADLRIIQEMLGHADIATTQIYTHVDSSRLRNIHRQFHPRSRLQLPTKPE